MFANLAIFRNLVLVLLVLVALFVPLGVWKLVEILYWVCTHISVQVF